MLNQLNAITKAMKFPRFSNPSESPISPIIPVCVYKSNPILDKIESVSTRARKPIAATIAGVTKGNTKTALIRAIFLISYLASVSAIQKPMMQVIVDVAAATVRV